MINQPWIQIPSHDRSITISIRWDPGYGTFEGEVLREASIPDNRKTEILYRFGKGYQTWFFLNHLFSLFQMKGWIAPGYDRDILDSLIDIRDREEKADG